MWGEFEDKVDELTMTMVANQVEFNEINGNSFVDHSQGKVGMLLAGAWSNLAADRQDVKEKQVVKKELDAQHLDCMTKGKKRISWIFGQDMCAIKICAPMRPLALNSVSLRVPTRSALAPTV